jgi:hypothetical protein
MQYTYMYRCLHFHVSRHSDSLVLENGITIDMPTDMPTECLLKTVMLFRLPHPEPLRSDDTISAERISKKLWRLTGDSENTYSTPLSRDQVPASPCRWVETRVFAPGEIQDRGTMLKVSITNR